MAAVVITLDDVEVTPVVLFASARFESQVNGKGGACSFRIRDEAGTATYQAGARIALTVDGDPVWSGYVTAVKRVYVFRALNVADFGTTRFFDIEGVDLNVLFARRIVFNQAEPEDVFGTLFPVGTPDTDAITALLADFLDLTGDDLDTSSGVVNVGDITVDQEGRAWSGSNTWGQAMASIGRIPGAIFYLHPDRTLIYTDDETATAPFALSDQPDGEGSKGYSSMEFLVDGSGLANDVFGWGIGYGSPIPIFKRITDTDSVNDHGLWQQAQTYFGTFKQATLDRNVESIIFGSPTNLRGAKDDRLAVTLTTFHPGLLPAMKVDFVANVFGQSVTLPIRKMIVTFINPETPKYELTLSHEIDTPYDLIDNLLINIRIPPFPPIPPFLPPGPMPPPPAPVSCGITDTFNRATTDYSDNALGIADCGRQWESYLQAIQGLRGRGLGAFSEDMPGAPTDTPSVGRLPGPWRVPFLGSIVVTAADSFPGFTFEPTVDNEHPTGFSWVRTGDAAFDGTDAVLPADPVNLSSSIEIGTSAVGGGLVYSPYQPLEITGHVRLVEASDPNGIELDTYVNFTFVMGSDDETICRVNFISGQPGEAELIIVGTADDPFPANFWEANGEADFTITYTGGFGGDLTFTVGPATVTKTLAADKTITEPFFRIFNASSYLPDPDTNATLYVEDPVEFNGQTVDAPFTWYWRFVGNAVNDDPVRLTFAHTAYGGTAPPGFPNGWNTGEVPFGDPYGASPDVVGPFIMVRIENLATNASVVSWVPGGPASYPYIPVVEADSFGATLTIGALTVTALGANAVDQTTGASSPIGLLFHMDEELEQVFQVNQGTYVEWDDLNIIGVNACTEGVINQTGNWLSVFFVGDGIRTTFALPGPFYRGTAAVYIDGLRQRQVVDYIEDPDAGTITFSTAPAFGAAIVVSYYPALGEVADPPGPPPAVGDVFGSALAIDGKDNRIIGWTGGREVAYRWVSDGGTLIGFRFNQRFGVDGGGYSNGDGGLIRVRVGIADAGLPPASFLTEATFSPNNPGTNAEDMPRLIVLAPVAIDPGTILVAVLDNVHADSENNWMSANMTWQGDPDTSPRQRAFSDDWAVLTRNEFGGTWTVKADNTPVFAAVFSNHQEGNVFGSIVAPEVYVDVDGTDKVRERFTTTGSMTISAIGFRVQRLSGTGDLEAYVDGTLFGTADISGVATSGSDPGDLVGGKWVEVAGSATLAAGEHTFEFRVPAGTVIRARPIREDGRETGGWTARGFPAGIAETSSGGPWSQMYNAYADLQFYAVIA